MLNTKKAVLDLFRENATANWFLYPIKGTSSFKIAECVGKSPEETIEKLDRVFESYGNKGRFLLVMSDKDALTADKTGRYDVEINLIPELAHNVEGIPQQAMMPQIGNMEEIIEKRVEERTRLIELQYSIKELTEKLEDKGNESNTRYFIDTLKPYLPKLMRMHGQTSSGIHGTNTIVTEQQTPSSAMDIEHDEERLTKNIESILTTVNQQGHNTGELFERLAQKIQQDPELINDLKDFI